MWPWTAFRGGRRARYTGTWQWPDIGGRLSLIARTFGDRGIPEGGPSLASHMVPPPALIAYMWSVVLWGLCLPLLFQILAAIAQIIGRLEYLFYFDFL